MFNLKCGIQKIFNRQQLNEKTESIVTPRIQEVNDGAGSSREILNENLYVSAEDENFETNNSISEENTPSILNSDKSELYSDFDPENTICSSDSDTVNLPKNVKSNKVVHFSVLYILLFSDTLFKLAFTAQRDNLLQKICLIQN